MPDNTPVGQPDAKTLIEGLISNHPQLTETALADPDDGGKAAREFITSVTPGGQPAPAVEPEQAAPAAAEPAPAPPAPPTLYAGKYRSVDDLEKGYWESVKRMQEVEAENRAIKAVETVIGGFRRERVDPTPPPPAAVPVSFDNAGNPVVSREHIDRLVAEQAGRIADERVNAALNPLKQMGEATVNLRNAYPDFKTRESDFAAWLQRNPDAQQYVAENPSRGLEYAWLKYDRTATSERTQAVAQTTQAAQATVDTVKRQAAAGNGSAQATRRPTETEVRASQLAKLKADCEQRGDMRPYQRAILETAVNEGGYLDNLAKTGWGAGR